MASAVKLGFSQEPRQDDGRPWTGKQFGGKCFNCQGQRLLRDCKEPRFYKCEKPGDLVRDCPLGNRPKGTGEEEPVCRWLLLQASDGA